MLRRLLAAVLTAGIALGGAAPVVASESTAPVAVDGQKKTKAPKKGKAKKGKAKKGKKAKKKAAKKNAPKKKAPAKGKKAKTVG